MSIPTPPQPSANPPQLEDRLWNPAITPGSYGEPKQYYEHILEIYKLYIGSAQQNSDRRGQANTFFLSINTFLVTAIGFIFVQNERLEPRWLIIFPLVAVLLLCYFWFRLIQSYQQLNAGKFLVIGALEEHLPARPFVKAEWVALGEGKDPSKYRPLTNTERLIPFFFAILYLFGALAITFY
jgi:hypothetical protein